MTGKIKIVNLLGALFLTFAFLLTSCSESDNDGGGPISNNSNNNSGPEIAPAFSLETHNGEKISFADYKDKVLVISFFGSSCPPCISVGPEIESKLHQEFSSNPNYGIVGIDQWDGNAATVEGFIDKTGVTFPLGLKGSGVAREYGTTYDRLVVVNADGIIAYSGKRIAANDLDEVVKIVKGLLN